MNLLVCPGVCSANDQVGAGLSQSAVLHPAFSGGHSKYRFVKFGLKHIHTHKYIKNSRNYLPHRCKMAQGVVLVLDPMQDDDIV